MRGGMRLVFRVSEEADHLGGGGAWVICVDVSGL